MVSGSIPSDKNKPINSYKNLINILVCCLSIDTNNILINNSSLRSIYEKISFFLWKKGDIILI